MEEQREHQGDERVGGEPKEHKGQHHMKREGGQLLVPPMQCFWDLTSYVFVCRTDDIPFSRLTQQRHHQRHKEDDTGDIQPRESSESTIHDQPPDEGCQGRQCEVPWSTGREGQTVAIPTNESQPRAEKYKHPDHIRHHFGRRCVNSQLHQPPKHIFWRCASIVGDKRVNGRSPNPSRTGNGGGEQGQHSR